MRNGCVCWRSWVLPCLKREIEQKSTGTKEVSRSIFGVWTPSRRWISRSTDRRVWRFRSAYLRAKIFLLWGKNNNPLPRMRKGFLFPSGGDVAFTVATARNRPSDARTAVPLGRHPDMFSKLSKVRLPAHFLHFSLQAQKTHWKGCVKWWQSANCVAGVAFAWNWPKPDTTRAPTWFNAPTCLVSLVWFSGCLPVSMGGAAKIVLLSCC